MKRKFPFHFNLPIRWRLSLWFIGLLMLVLVGFSLLFYFTLKTNLSSNIDDTLNLRAAQLQREISLGLASKGIDLPAFFSNPQTETLEAFAEPDVYVQVIDSSAKVLAATPNLSGQYLPVTPSMLKTLSDGTKNNSEIKVSKQPLRILTQPVRLNNEIVGALQVAELLDPYYGVLSQVRIWLLVGNSLTLLLAVAGGWWLVGRALRPVVKVTQTAHKIATTRNFEERIPLKTEPQSKLDEIGQLSATFNAMIAEVSRVFQTNRQFMADTSHELRTPLTVIRGNLNLLRRGLSQQEAEEAILEAEEESERLSRLVGDLLLLAQTDAQQTIEHASVQLDEIMLRATHRAEQIAQNQARKLKISLEHHEPLLVMGDEMRLSQVINNLVENAIRYTPDNGQITLYLKKKEGHALIGVRDSGIPIPPEHLAHLFERFYRVDRARSRALGGTGLGLSIVKYLTEAHQGHVRVESKPGQGTLFEISLPLAEAE